jgi:GNAT superfamily N-acetyltransferase
MLIIRPARADDASVLTTMIHELAKFEHLEQGTIVTEDDILRDGFGDKPKFRSLIAEWDGQAAGYALFFEFYSTFQARAGLFLEDIFVRSQFRQKGIGTALLARVARIAEQESYFCLRWEVLDWNQPAIDFYNRLGACFRNEWKAVSLTGDALQSVAARAS